MAGALRTALGRRFVRTASPLVTALVGALLAAACARTAPPAPVTVYGLGKPPSDSVIVESGDTAFHIARQYGVPLRDLIETNNLRPPYMLHIGQNLNIPTPRSYKVRRLDTLYGISRMFGVEMTEIARINRLDQPYELKVGHDLRLPSAFGARQVAEIPPSRPTVTRQATRPAIVRSTPEPAKPKLGKPQKTATAVKKTPTKSRPVPAIEPPALFSEKFRWPVEGRVVSPFGPKSNGLHNDGINIKASRGTPVEAAENGVVAYAGNELRGFGNLLLIRHSDSWMSAYAHLEKVDVTRGTVIKRGQIVGKVGSSGSVGEPQLHFEIRKGSRAINPLKYLAKRGAGG